MTFAWLPNAICIGRALLVLPIVVLLAGGQYVGALVLIVMAGASDAVDGYLAKTFDWRSRLGSLLDPAADKLLIFAVFITLTWIGLVPLTLTLIVILRDVVIVLGAVTYHLRIRRLNGLPSRISKLNMACQLGFVVFVVAYAAFGWPPPVSVSALGAAVVFTSIVSGLHYVIVWARLAREATGATV